MSKNRIIFLSVMVMCSLVLLGCKESSRKVDPLNFDIPDTWSLVEDTQRTEQHRKIVLMTSNSDFAEMELLEGDQAFSIDSRDYMTRYIKAAFPTETLRKQTEFELGDVSRGGQAGYFMLVTAPGRTQVQFTLEFYQFASRNHNLFAVLTINPSVTPEQQVEFDKFLASINLGE